MTATCSGHDGHARGGIDVMASARALPGRRHVAGHAGEVSATH